MVECFSDSSAFVAVHRPKNCPGNLMYIILNDREAFDLIDLPEGGNGNVRHKTIDDGTQYVVFQFWLTKPESNRR